MSNKVISALQAAIEDTSTVLVKGTKTYKLQDSNLPVAVGVTYFNSLLAKLKAEEVTEKALARENAPLVLAQD